MATKKKVTEDVTVETSEIKEEVRKELSKAQLEFVNMMTKYKEQNPVKYAKKEEELMRKLNSL
jgi:hypothetical protein